MSQGFRGGVVKRMEGNGGERGAEACHEDLNILLRGMFEGGKRVRNSRALSR